MVTERWKLLQLPEEERLTVTEACNRCVIEFSGDYLDLRAQKGFDLSFYLKIGRFPFRTLIIDTLVLITSSFVLTFLVMKKVMPALKLRYSKEE
ncbi:MAG: hypothetical protein HXS44_06920 [Theionarchaea archaeon]|nr:hypothetical protein [Theionarchaea archaeon]MBU7017224.1 hypothetical protein [Theionarchaea archaeon]